MSIDKLQKAIRRLKNPLMVAFSADFTQIPPQCRDESRCELANFIDYAKGLLLALKDTVPAVRFDFGSYAVCGPEGTAALMELLEFANDQGYYVLLDAPQIYSPRQGELIAKNLFEGWRFDGLLLSCYTGTDGVKPFVEYIRKNEKDLFIILRTANRSASELQDLLTGSRFVHSAAADIAKRLGEGLVARCGYSYVAGVGPATSASVLQNLRSKYPSLFLLVDGLDYSGANAKNCAAAFDKLGHGAVVCVSSYVTAAWQNPEAAGESPVALAVRCAERLKKNLNRYVTIL